MTTPRPAKDKRCARQTQDRRKRSGPTLVLRREPNRQTSPAKANQQEPMSGARRVAVLTSLVRTSRRAPVDAGAHLRTGADRRAARGADALSRSSAEGSGRRNLRLKRDSSGAPARCAPRASRASWHSSRSDAGHARPPPLSCPPPPLSCPPRGASTARRRGGDRAPCGLSPGSRCLHAPGHFRLILAGGTDLEADRARRQRRVVLK